MQIKKATKFDLPEIIEMLKHFRENTPISIMAECDNHDYISQLIHHILIGRGIVLLAEKDSRVIGMIMGYIDKTIWDPNILVMNELAFWVEPEYRGTSAAYRLIKTYNDEVNKLKGEGRIKLFTMSKMINSPDLDYGRFGYKKIEEHWVGGI